MTPEVRYHFHLIISRYIQPTWFIMFILDHLAEVVWVRFLHWKVILFFSFFILYFLEGNCYVQSALNKWFKGERSTRLELCVDGRFVNTRFVSLSFTQLIISIESLTYPLVYSRLVLYCVAHIVPSLVVGSSLCLFLCFFDTPQLFCVRVYVLLP